MMRIARVAKDLHGRGGSISRLAPGTMRTSLVPRMLTLMRVEFTRSLKDFLPVEPPPQADLSFLFLLARRTQVRLIPLGDREKPGAERIAILGLGPGDYRGACLLRQVETMF